jgi:uroporphyrinogen-III synthase
MTARVLITGPIEGAADYARAAEEAGWVAIELPVLAVETMRVDVPTLARARYDWICITSSSALEFLTEAAREFPEITGVPCAVVGARTAERLHALGFTLGIPATSDAAALADALAQHEARGARVLWPRGSISDELAHRLRALHFDVSDPVVYTTRELASRARAPATDAVFFASPSAVRAWFSAAGGDSSSARTAIAIGRTTFDALLAETEAAFFDTISLPEPTPAAFALVLQHLDLSTPS